MSKVLNLPCRHKVSADSSLNTYTFSTDSGAEYKVLFELFHDVFSGTAIEKYDCYNVNIVKTKSGNGIKDPEILNTIDCIIEHFFENKERILVYTCDSSDQKELSRYRLFKIWFANSRIKNQIVKIDTEINDVYQNVTYLSGVIHHTEISANNSTITESIREVKYVLEDK